MARSGKTPKLPRNLSGATGGPATGRGIDFQIEYAINRALELICRQLNAPHRSFAITMEPRAVGPGDPTRWDLRINPPDELAEVKLDPTRQDVLDWIDRTGKSAAASQDRTFTLVYSQGRGGVLLLLRHLHRLANEAAGDANRLRQLLELEQVAGAETVLDRLNPLPAKALQRMGLQQMPEQHLVVMNGLISSMLAGASGGQQLRALLSRKFHAAMSERTTTSISELIEEARRDGITLQSPPEVRADDLSASARSALFILQACTAGVPLEVLAEAIGQSPAALRHAAAELIGTGIIGVVKEVWSLRPLPTLLTQPDESALVAKALTALVGWIGKNYGTADAQGQLFNVVVLAQKATGPHPEAVAPLFIREKRLEKQLKRAGDKHLVLQLADLVLAAARRAPRTEEGVKAEAHALICGRSWVLQRVGRLSEAQAFAEKSLELGERIRWERNTAYCKKCIGRLFRMQAEREQDPLLKKASLSRSVTHLEEAIGRFSESKEFGPDHPEVGDCHSLLARTHFVARDIAKAEHNANLAEKLIGDPASKEYMDLLILLGDLAVARTRLDDAEAHYSEALRTPQDGGAERSEIRARALLQRGHLRARRRDERALKDFEDASRIWLELQEDDAAAKAQWFAKKSAGEVSDDAARSLEGEPYGIRMEALRLHEQRQAAMQGYRGRRSGESEAYWRQLIDEARANDTVTHVDW